jgi:hypothetical protein
MNMKNVHALNIYWPFKVKFIVGLITSWMQDMFTKKREGQANGFIFEFVVKTWVNIMV